LAERLVRKNSNLDSVGCQPGLDLDNVTSEDSVYLENDKAKTFKVSGAGEPIERKETIKFSMMGVERTQSSRENAKGIGRKVEK